MGKKHRTYADDHEICVMLNEAKHLIEFHDEMLHFVQHDNGLAMKRSSFCLRVPSWSSWIILPLSSPLADLERLGGRHAHRFAHLYRRGSVAPGGLFGVVAIAALVHVQLAI